MGLYTNSHHYCGKILIAKLDPLLLKLKLAIHGTVLQIAVRIEKRQADSAIIAISTERESLLFRMLQTNGICSF